MIRPYCEISLLKQIEHVFRIYWLCDSLIIEAASLERILFFENSTVPEERWLFLARGCPRGLDDHMV